MDQLTLTFDADDGPDIPAVPEDWPTVELKPRTGRPPRDRDGVFSFQPPSAQEMREFWRDNPGLCRGVDATAYPLSISEEVSIQIDTQGSP